MPRRAQAASVAGLLAVFFLAIVTAAAGKSATYDEPVHIYAGWRILTAGDLTINHEHPPLLKALAATPLAMMRVAEPHGRIRRESDQWSVSHEFLYHVNDAGRMLAAARLPVGLLAAGMAYALYRWAARSLGAAPALAALALLVSEPNVLAHSGLVTTDLAMTAATLFTYAAFLGHLRSPSRGRLLGSGALFGLALLTKFTAVLLIPILVVGGAVWVHREGRRRWRPLLVSLAAVGATGLLVLNAGYGFGGTFSSLRDFPAESERFRSLAAGPLGAVPLPVPREYVRGFDHAEAGGQRWQAYLFGEHSTTGWRHYYLAALAVKTPLPLLLLSAAALVAWPLAGARRAAARDPRGGATIGPGASPEAWMLFAVPVLVILTAFTAAHNLKNIGLRYILPAHPFLCLLAASLLAAPLRWAWRDRVVWALVAWQILAAAWIYPDFLTFFNLAVGGPSRGAEVLLDSNLDWGQDLKGLGRYVRERRIETIYVDYFGRGCLRYYGVASTPDFEGGSIAVSATNLKGVYSDRRDRYRFLEDLSPVARIGGSIFVYDVPRPPDWEPRRERPPE